MFKTTLVSALILCFSAGFVTSANLLEMKIWTDKPDYLVREPIVVNYSVKNIGNTVINLNLTEIGFCLNIKDQAGNSYPAHLSLSYGFAFPDSLIPAEKHDGGVNITDLYKVVSEGEYTCFLENPGSKQADVSVPTREKSNVIKIKVKNPTGDEKNALDMLLEADQLKYSRDEQHGGRDLKKAELGFLKYQELASRYPNSVYAALALNGAVGVYQYSPDFEAMKKVIPVCRRLIENYPNTIYFMSAFTSIEGVYEVLKDKAGAINEINKLIQKHPNSKISEEAERRLDQIEKWKF